MKIRPWIKVWLLWTLTTTGGVTLVMMLPIASPLMPLTPVAIATLTGLFQTGVVAYLKLIRRPWLWIVITAAGGCLNLVMGFMLSQATLGAITSGVFLGFLQSLLLKTSGHRRLRWTSSAVLWIMVTALSYGFAGFWVINLQGIGGLNPPIWIGLQAGLMAGALKGAVVAPLVDSPKAQTDRLEG
ncbi:hypothetical protein C7271_08055 [filamentous cyanobacterium CCP5]|nr:hypothetical protein C7271_08055 [filamentous cyanobacterium CCP5]